MKKLIIIGLVLLLAGFAISAELMSFYKAKWSGLNDSVNIRLLQDDESSSLANFSLDEIGSIKERDLFGQYNSSSGALGSNYITFLGKHYTTTSKYFFACAGTKIGLGSGGVFTDITPTNSSVVAGSYYSGLSFNNRFYLFNPNDEPFVYTGTGSFHKLGNASAIPSSNCSYSAVHKSRVWAARSDTYPYRLYWSSLNTAENWTATGGYADLPDINQEIKGIISWGGYLYIFTETNIYVLLGSTPNDFSLRKTNSMVGCIAPRSIKVTDIGICFLSRSGVYAFDGNNSNKISTKIETTISGISKTLIQNACGIYDGRRYWLSYTPSGSSYNSQIIIYDIYLKDWTIYKGSACNISYFERAYGGTDKGELYGGSSTTNGFVYQLQAASGTELINDSTKADFDNNVSYNTVVTDTPAITLGQGNDQYTKLLIKFDGTDGSTANYITEDDTKRSCTMNSGAKLSSTQKKFGTTSLYLDGGDDFLNVPDNPGDDFGSSDFTIDFWVYFNNIQSGYFIGHFTNPNGWAVYYSAGPNNWIQLNSTWADEVHVAWTPVTGQWYHVAVVKSGSAIKFFVNGSQQGTDQTAAATYNADTNDARIGDSVSAHNYLAAYIDEFRISNGVARWTSGFTLPNVEYSSASMGGTSTSQNMQINNSGASSLGEIEWLETLPSNTKISFQTRTGATNDSVYFNGWQYWSSANTVTLNTVTDGTAIFTSSDNINFILNKPLYPQKRDVLYYEEDDVVSANCVTINTVGAVSKGKYIEAFIPTTDLSSYDWLTGWYKAKSSTGDNMTGNTIEFYIGEGVSSSNYVTFNTVASNSSVDGWYKWYWYIGDITSTDRDNINYIKYRYTGDSAGSITVAEVNGQNFYETGDTMSSTPNDWIQYRAIFGTNDTRYTPELTSVTLTYTPALSTSESSLSSYYYTKWFDFKSPQLNKQFDSMVLELNSTTASTVTGSSALCRVYCDYDIDFGTKTGTMEFQPKTTDNTVRILKNFPSSTYGKAMRLKIYNNDKDAQVTVKGCEVRYRTESVQDN